MRTKRIVSVGLGSAVGIVATVGVLHGSAAAEQAATVELGAGSGIVFGKGQPVGRTPATRAP